MHPCNAMCMLKALILVGTYGDEAREWWWR